MRLARQFYNWLRPTTIRLIMAPRSRRHRVAVVSTSVVAILVIGFLDATTGRDPSFSVFYLLVVSTATVLVSTSVGYLLAFISAVTWVLADNFWIGHIKVIFSVWNGTSRALTISMVVFLLGALRSSLIETAESRQRTQDFLATASHQIRTPVAGVMVSAEALLLEADDERRVHLTENLVESCKRLGRLLASLLSLSRIDEIDGAEEPRPVDLVGTCRVEVNSAQVRHPDLRFECHMPRSTAGRVHPPAISEAIANLLDNASRHAISEVRLDLWTDHDQIVLEVKDDGPGVPPGMEEQIFERFIAADGEGGSGLGLPIARGLVESQGGTLTYADASTFRITVPSVVS